MPELPGCLELPERSHYFRAEPAGRVHCKISNVSNHAGYRKRYSQVPRLPLQLQGQGLHAALWPLASGTPAAKESLHVYAQTTRKLGISNLHKPWQPYKRNTEAAAIWDQC